MNICNVESILSGIFLEFEGLKILRPYDILIMKVGHSMSSRRVSPESGNYPCPRSSTGKIHGCWEGCTAVDGEEFVGRSEMKSVSLGERERKA